MKTHGDDVLLEGHGGPELKQRQIILQGYWLELEKHQLVLVKYQRQLKNLHRDGQFSS